MDIVDAQIHMGPGTIDANLEAMNAIGIRSVLIDEYWYRSESAGGLRNQPGFELPNGAWRSIYPTAELASTLHPDRFSYFVRLDRNDPQIEMVMHVLASSPHARAFRFLAVATPVEAAAFCEGGFDRAFEIAQDAGLPVCLFIPGYVEYLPRYLKKFPRLQFVVDHWGLVMGQDMRHRPEAEARRAASPDYLDEVVKLAAYPNVAIKISHAHMFFAAGDYPYEPIRRVLRRAITSFGADRLIWSSDKTVVRPAIGWSDLVHYIRDDPELSLDEKQQILGRNARRLFNWPAQAS
jgi:predicted TIM-barrel fold metal-dependent hydrolase